jgi:subtilisin family serine protease
VAYVEQDRTATLSGVQSNPPSWGLDRIDQRALPLSATYTFTAAPAVTAYILDTGIRTSHVEFGGRARSGWDFVGKDADAADCDGAGGHGAGGTGHGTHVAGTIGGATYGVARSVKLVGVRVLDCVGSGSYSQIIAGIDWVTRNAVRPAVVNMSLGGPGSTALDAAIQRSIAAGISYVVAAGNESVNACTRTPARVPAAITVGATDRYDARAWFSNTGTCLDLFAPGVAITSAVNTGSTALGTWSGTSMASPHVAGAAALVLQAHPGYTPKQVRDALVATATTGKVTSPGTGSPNRLLFTGPGAQVSVGRTIPTSGTLTSQATLSGCTGNASKATRVTFSLALARGTTVAAELVGPSGTVYPLHTYAAGNLATSVSATYSVDASRQPWNGTWKLRLRTVTAAPTTPAGSLRTWSLSV